MTRLRVTGVGALVAAFVVLRLVATVTTPVRFPDTQSYLQLNFLGLDTRLWTVPLIWDLLGSDDLRELFQIGLGLIAWPLLAGAVAAALRDRGLRLVAVAGILLIGLVPQVTGWDSTMLSESLATSLWVIGCALLVRMSVARSPRLVAFTLCVTLCWVFTRQSNGVLYLSLLPFVLIFCLRRLDGRERVIVAATLVVIGVWGAVALTRNTPASDAVWAYNAVQIIENRIAPSPDELTFFTARGLPPSPTIAAERGDFPGGISPLFQDRTFMTWIHTRFRPVYASYLLHRWPATLVDPLRHAPGAITGPVTDGLPGRTVLPLLLRTAVWGPGPAQILIWLLVMVACAGFALVRRARVRFLPVTGLLLLSAAIGALETWNLTGIGGGELARLFLPVAVSLRIAIVLVITLSLDALVVTRAASAAGVGSASASPVQTTGHASVPSGARGPLQPSGSLAWVQSTATRTAGEWQLRSALGIAGGALVATLGVLPWLDHAVLVGPVALTPGRLLLATGGLAVIADVHTQRSLAVLRRPLTIALVASLLVGVALVAGSAFTNGCNCRGSVAGLEEFAALGVIATYVLARDGLWAGRFIYAAAAGVLVATILALPDLPSGARATGSYGNPNNLAFALALGLPIVVAATIDARRARRRAAFATFAAVLAGMIVLTYSRGGVLAAAAGLIVFAVIRGSGRRVRGLIGGGAVAAAALGFVLYPAFAGSRVDADLLSPTRGTLTLHQAGWDPLATGLIPAGPTALSSLHDGSLRVVAGAAGEGASLSIGTARAGIPYTVTLDARSPSGARVLWLGLEDNKRALGPSHRIVPLSRQMQRYSITWTPLGTARHARVYAWLEAPGSFELDNATLRAGAPNSPPSALTTAPVSPTALSRAQVTTERHNLHFRSRMLSLAWRAFVDHPLRGIGWERFPLYAAARSDYGEQGAQSEYARYAAELGIGGVLFILALGVSAAVGLCRSFPHRPAVAGSLVVATVGLAFDNALETISISAIVAVMLAIACTRAAAANPS